MTDVHEAEDGEADNQFDVSLQMSHPTMHPDLVTHTLGMQPDGGWAVGTPRQTPAGTPLDGYRRQSYWYVSERFEQRRDFFDAILEFIGRILEPHAEFLERFNGTGGEVTVCLQLPGYNNIGDVISSNGLARIAALGIEFSVEVFPDMN